MGVYKQKGSNRWWYKFNWNGTAIRKSTKQTNKRVAEQMEAAHKAALAKGEVGIRERKEVPTIAEFGDGEFLTFVESRFCEKTQDPGILQGRAQTAERLRPTRQIEAGFTRPDDHHGFHRSPSL